MSLLWLLCLSILLPSGILYEFRPFTFTPYSSKKYQKQKTYKDRELALTVHDVIPDVIECTPQFQLEVTYLEEFKVDHGNILEINNVAFAPLKVEWPAEKNESYVLSMTGPDYPSRENRSEYEEWNHWLVVNIEGDKWLNGDVIAPYIPPYCRKGLGSYKKCIRNQGNVDKVFPLISFDHVIQFWGPSNVPLKDFHTFIHGRPDQNM